MDQERRAPPLKVCLVEDQPEPLVVRQDQGGLTAFVRTGNLNQAILRRWLSRRCTGAKRPSLITEETTRFSVPTEVFCVDSRVVDQARVYANLVNASMCRPVGGQAVATEIRKLPQGRTLTVVLLSDRLDESLCNAIFEGNEARRKDGLSPVQYGFLCALTAEHLAWLIVKTFVLLRSSPRFITFARWDFGRPEVLARTRETTNGNTSEWPITAPWSDDSVDVLCIRAHGASFDLSLGDTVLCGHQDPPLSPDRTVRAPSCVHDGICFRMGKGPNRRLLAAEATPLVWCLDSCSSVPLTGNAFGTGVSYAFGLVSGAAAAVIGPYLDIPTQGGLMRVYEGLIATGSTLGEVARLVCDFESSRGFDRFLLIGSPDLRLLPANPTEPRVDDDQRCLKINGRSQFVWRISVPDSLGSSASVVGDDGAECWGRACYDRIKVEARDALLVTLETPVDIDGWIRLGMGSESLDGIREHAREVATNLSMLAHFPFVAPEAEPIQLCRHWTETVERLTAHPERLRSCAEVAGALAHLHVALNALHVWIIQRFSEHVTAQDVSLDRIPGEGFELGPTIRTSSACPTCRGALYVTVGHWCQNRFYTRRWVQCANCGGLALSRTDSLIEVRSLTGRRTVRADRLQIIVRLRNRSSKPLHVVLAGQPRRRGLDTLWGPHSLMLGPRAWKTVRFVAPGRINEPGVISYRLLMLCNAGVELFALRHGVDSDRAKAPQATVLTKSAP